MPVDEKRAAATQLREHAKTLTMLLNPHTAGRVQPDAVRAVVECLRNMADALDRNANTEN